MVFTFSHIIDYVAFTYLQRVELLFLSKMRANSPGDTTKLLWLRTINHTCETFRNTFFPNASALCESNATFRFHGQWPKFSRLESC